VRWAGLRSNAAVDMFGRGAAVTIILFSSGNAQHAVPRNSLLRRCWSYAKQSAKQLSTTLAFCAQWPFRQFSSSRMYAMNTSQYRKQHEPELKIYKNYSNTNKKTDSETAFRNLNQGEKVLSPNYVFSQFIPFIAISGRYAED
jgi:hypothetical protein